MKEDAILLSMGRTGGVIIDSFNTILNNYTQGKGFFRIRAKWETEDLGKGQYQIIIKEIPYQVVKSKLIEKIAQLLNDKKLPMLSDVRDESTHDVRIVLEPKSLPAPAAVRRAAALYRRKRIVYKTGKSGNRPEAFLV